MLSFDLVFRSITISLCLALLVNTGCRRGSSSPPAASGASAGSGSAAPTGLDGTWKATAAELGGFPHPLEALGPLAHMEISGTTIRYKVQGIDFAEGTIQVDPSQQPKTMVIRTTILQGRTRGKTDEAHAIYELSENTLKLCSFDPKSGQRLTALQSRPGSGDLLITYLRVR
jgi:uncharacterized protein (TIGR03067 family)